jgi:hypothetical protein
MKKFIQDMNKKWVLASGIIIFGITPYNVLKTIDSNRKIEEINRTPAIYKDINYDGNKEQIKKTARLTGLFSVGYKEDTLFGFSMCNEDDTLCSTKPRNLEGKI